MKKHLTNLMYVAFLGLATLTTSCSDDDSKNAAPYEIDENHVVLTGEDNMRDLGGYVGQDGKRVLYHKLFRSGELSALTATDLEHIATKEITQVIDLRTTEERTEKTDKAIAGTTRYELSLIDELTGANGGVNQNDIFGMILSGQMSAEEIMIPAYALDETKITQWTKIFDLLESGQTTLWHCTAGKDRAGMTTALVLSSLGVDRQVIVNDFMLSNTYLSAYNLQTVSYINSQYGAGVGEQLMPLLGVEEEYITTFFKNIETTYGSVDSFLKVLKVDTAKMKKNFLEK
ncbi:tyrosine-protein phosphatase [Flavobacterium hauense]